MSQKDKIINHIIKIEGGYVNDPSDSGGETNWGITKSVARANGYYGDMKDMPKSKAFEIYEKKYWHSLRLDDVEELDRDVAAELADTGINMGTGRAAEFLQRSLNVLNNRGQHYPDLVVDRSIGPATISALTAYKQRRGKEGMKILFQMLNCLQGAYYVTLSERREKDEKFIYGWFKNRVE
jgi:lysozyme family protein